MIDHYVLTSSAEDLAELLRGSADPATFEHGGEIVPPASAPVLRLDDAGGRRLSLLRWGLVPAWAPDLGFGQVCINARAESALTKPAFRQALRRRRCLVPADAFHAAAVENGRIRQHRVERTDGAPFTFAGLWESWCSPAGETVETFALVTAGVTAIRPHGLPVVIESRNHALWLDPAATQFDRQLRLLRPLADTALRIARGTEEAPRFAKARQNFGELVGRADQLEREARAEILRAQNLVRDIQVETARRTVALGHLKARLDHPSKEPF